MTCVIDLLLDDWQVEEGSHRGKQQCRHPASGERAPGKEAARLTNRAQRRDPGRNGAAMTGDKFLE